MGEWTREWPEQEGMYWFYGYKFTPEPNEVPKLYTGQVWKISNGCAHIIDGHFVYASEGCCGYWMLADLPMLPEWEVRNVNPSTRGETG